MPTIVELPDKTEVEFPEGMDQLAIRREIVKAFPNLGQQTPTERPAIPAPGERGAAMAQQQPPAIPQEFPEPPLPPDTRKPAAPTQTQREALISGVRQEPPPPEAEIQPIGEPGSVLRGATSVATSVLNRPEYLAALANPITATAVGARFLPEVAKQFFEDLGKATQGDNEALGRAAAIGLPALVGVVKGGKTVTERLDAQALLEKTDFYKKTAATDAEARAQMQPPPMLKESQAELNKIPGGPDATETRQEQASVPEQRPGTDAQRLPAETSSSDSLQPKAPEQQPEVLPRNVPEQQPQPPAQEVSPVRDVDRGPLYDQEVRELNEAQSGQTIRGAVSTPETLEAGRLWGDSLPAGTIIEEADGTGWVVQKSKRFGTILERVDANGKPLGTVADGKEAHNILSRSKLRQQPPAQSGGAVRDVGETAAKQAEDAARIKEAKRIEAEMNKLGTPEEIRASPEGKLLTQAVKLLTPEDPTTAESAIQASTAQSSLPQRAKGMPPGARERLQKKVSEVFPKAPESGPVTMSGKTTEGEPYHITEQGLYQREQGRWYWNKGNQKIEVTDPNEISKLEAASTVAATPEPTPAGKVEPAGAPGYPKDIQMPRKGVPESERDAEFQRYMADTDRYYAELKAWEEAQPQNKPLIFKRGDNYYSAITKDPQGGWRATTFMKMFKDDDRLVPWGHERYKTRAQAVREIRGEPVSELPSEIMTEDEIKAHSTRPVADAPAESPPAPEISKGPGAASPSDVTEPGNRVFLGLLHLRDKLIEHIRGESTLHEDRAVSIAQGLGVQSGAYQRVGRVQPVTDCVLSALEQRQLKLSAFDRRFHHAVQLAKEIGPIFVDELLAIHHVNIRRAFSECLGGIVHSLTPSGNKPACHRFDVQESFPWRLLGDLTDTRSKAHHATDNLRRGSLGKPGERGCRQFPEHDRTGKLKGPFPPHEPIQQPLPTFAIAYFPLPLLLFPLLSGPFEFGLLIQQLSIGPDRLDFANAVILVGNALFVIVNRGLSALLNLVQRRTQLPGRVGGDVSAFALGLVDELD